MFPESISNKEIVELRLEEKTFFWTFVKLTKTFLPFTKTVEKS